MPPVESQSCRAPRLARLVSSGRSRCCPGLALAFRLMQAMTMSQLHHDDHHQWPPGPGGRSGPGT